MVYQGDRILALLTYDKPIVTTAGEYNLKVLHKQVLSFSFEQIQLEQFSWKDFRHSRNPITSALMAKMRIASLERPELKYQCLQLLTTFKLPLEKQRTIGYFIESYLDLSESEMKSFKTQIEKAPKKKKKKEAVMEMMTSWERQGFKEGEKRGRQKGREEGRKEEHRKSTLRILTHRFGELDQSLQSQISKLSPTKLDALFDAALEFTSKDELIAWLQQP